MKDEKRVYEIYVGNIDEDIVSKFKNKTVMGPGIVYAPYVPMFIEGKILKVKEWLRFKKYSRYTAVNIDKIPEIDLKIESRTVETKEWKVVAGVAVGKLGQELKLTEEEADFNKISEELKKRGL